MSVIITTTERVPGYRIKRYLGLVYGYSVRARSAFGDLAAGFQKFFGGSISAYRKTLNETVNEAINDMINAARRLGANAIIGVKFMTTEIMPQAAELYVYGTAVEIEPESGEAAPSAPPAPTPANVCPKCGSPLPPDSKFCPVCGARIA